MSTMFSDAVITLILFIFMAFVIGFLCIYRAEIKRFFSDKDYGTSFKQDREKLLRRDTEDAEDELDWLEEKERKQKAETGEVIPPSLPRRGY